MPRRLTSSLVHALLLVTVAALPPAGAAEFFAGDYSFSDELGGFLLLGASGTCTVDDPVVVREELLSIEPVTLVIRRHNELRFDRHPVQSQLTLVKEIVNRSERVWAGFDVELQEVYEKPSTYSDGLSFKQFASQPQDVYSDTFTLNDRRFEPYDRISFQGGSVDPGGTFRIQLAITDPTPVAEFYLRQDPNLVSVELVRPGRSFALIDEASVRSAARPCQRAARPSRC
jgi:hypothetical protein